MHRCVVYALPPQHADGVKGDWEWVIRLEEMSSVSAAGGRIVKILMCGDSGAGKSCLLLRFCDDAFMPSYITTIGLDFKVKTIVMNGDKIKVQVWDTAGQERFKSIVNAYFRGANALIFCYDVTDRNSFVNVRNWIFQANTYAPENVPRILVGNKIDLLEREITTTQGQALADNYNMPYFETSAKTGKNVETAFLSLVQTAVHKSPPPNPIQPVQLQETNPPDACTNTQKCAK